MLNIFFIDFRFQEFCNIFKIIIYYVLFPTTFASHSFFIILFSYRLSNTKKDKLQTTKISSDVDWRLLTLLSTSLFSSRDNIKVISHVIHFILPHDFAIGDHEERGKFSLENSYWLINIFKIPHSDESTTSSSSTFSMSLTVTRNENEKLKQIFHPFLQNVAKKNSTASW